jgi:hypothetical protein
MNAYFLELLVRERLAEARAAGTRAARIRSLRPPRRSVRATLGIALIKIGHWLVGQAHK